MPDESRLADLAGAVADGLGIDWGSASDSAATEDERELVASFQGLAAIGGFFANLTSEPARLRRERPRLEPGAEWGPLRVIGHVGRGRFGDVYRAWDPALAREVALKLIASGSAPLDEQVVDEGRLMARVRHPNVVTIHGARRVDDVAGLWMEFIEGRTLEAELAERGAFSGDELVAVGIQLCGAIAAVHAAGLVHRDVKASNVLRGRDGRLVLGDFGTGGELDQDDDTRAGLVGTPAYLAPEIFNRQPATPQSDIYSLGVLLFHLATSRYPFPDRSLAALRTAHASGTAAALADSRPDLPEAVVRVINRSLQADPSRRFESADEMARAFEACRSADGRRRRARWVAAGIAAGLVACATGWFAWRQAHPFRFAERDWVLVAAFENLTGARALEGALEGALGLELGSSPLVRVVPRARIEDTLALMRRSLDTRVDARVGREVALRDGQIRAVLAGQVDRLGQGYRLTAEVHDARDGAIVSSLDEQAAGDADLLPAVARLAAKVRSALSETLPALADSSAGGPPRVTTQSLTALTLYQRALPHMAPGANPRVAEQLLAEAVREDPEFAVAHVALAKAIFVQRLTTADPPRFRAEEVDAHLAAASRASAHVTVEDRYRITAETAAIEMARSRGADRAAHQHRALAALEALHGLQPDDVPVLVSLLELGDARAARVIPLAERLVSLRPNSPYVLVFAAQRAASADEHDLARSYLERARPLLDLPTAEFAGDGPAVGGRQGLFNYAWIRDDVHEAMRLAEELAIIIRRSAPEAASIHAEGTARKFLLLGQLDRAEALALSLLRNDGIRELILGSIALSRRDPDAAREYLDRHGIDASFPNAVSFLGLFIRAGRLDEARLAVDAMRREARAPADFAATWEAQLAIAEGQPERAIALLEPVLAGQANTVRSNDLADAWLLAGNLEEAIRVLERAAAEPRLRQVGAGHHWLEQQDRLARLYREVGREADAERVDARLRVLMTFADNDHPIKRRLDALAQRQ